MTSPSLAEKRARIKQLAREEKLRALRHKAKQKRQRQPKRKVIQKKKKDQARSVRNILAIMKGAGHRAGNLTLAQMSRFIAENPNEFGVIGRHMQDATGATMELDQAQLYDAEKEEKEEEGKQKVDAAAEEEDVSIVSQ